MDVKQSTAQRADRYKLAIKTMILSQLPPARIREIRREYLSGRETIAEYSQRTGVPPVLLWSLLTPLFEKTHKSSIGST
jgi:hypothetical protein